MIEHVENRQGRPAGNSDHVSVWYITQPNEMKKHLFAVLLSVSAFWACSSAPLAVAGPSPAPARIDAVVFAFAEDLTSFVRAGATAQVTALGVFSDSSTRDVTSTCVDWRSDDMRVLTVDRGGLMTAQSDRGSATITTTCQSVSARGVVAVNLSLPPAAGVPGSPGSSSCTAPPYAFDPPPNSSICRGSDGRFAFSFCCRR